MYLEEVTISRKLLFIARIINRVWFMTFVDVTRNCCPLLLGHLPTIEGWTGRGTGSNDNW